MSPHINPGFVEPDSIKSAIHDIRMYATDGGLYPGATILLICDDAELDALVARRNPQLPGNANICWTPRSGTRTSLPRNTTGTKSTPAAQPRRTTSLPTRMRHLSDTRTCRSDSGWRQHAIGSRGVRPHRRHPGNRIRNPDAGHQPSSARAPLRMSGITALPHGDFHLASRRHAASHAATRFSVIIAETETGDNPAAGATQSW